MQPYNSGRMLIHGHRQDKGSVLPWVLVLQIRPVCVLHACFACGMHSAFFAEIPCQRVSQRSLSRFT